jgi:hypothetical protein
VLKALAVFAIVCAPLAAGATEKTTSKTAQECSSGCLLDVMNRYLDALLAHDSSGLPLAADLKATENGHALKFTEGLWKSAGAITYRHTVVDPVAGQAVFYGVVGETEGSAMVVFRLAVKRQQIAEIETLVARKGAHALFSPESLTGVKPVWNQVVPEAERSPRAKMIEIANSYFEGIEKHVGNITPFHPDCNRTENGVQTTNGSSRFGSSCSMGISHFSYITKVRSRRYPLVDEARGIVLGIVHFDVPGDSRPAAGSDAVSALATTSRTLLLYELFKIESGRIREIQAFMSNAPFGASNGWEQ